LQADWRGGQAKKDDLEKIESFPLTRYTILYCTEAWIACIPAFSETRKTCLMQRTELVNLLVFIQRMREEKQTVFLALYYDSLAISPFTTS
jgi:hypothetical protein